MIQLSERIKKNADRVGGVYLHIPWPAALGKPPECDVGEELEVEPSDHAWATAQLPAHRVSKNGVEIVHVASFATRGFGKHRMTRENQTFLVLVLIGSKWVHATGVKSKYHLQRDANAPSAVKMIQETGRSENVGDV